MRGSIVRGGSLVLVTALTLSVAGCGSDSTSPGNNNGGGGGGGVTPVVTTSVAVKGSQAFAPPDIKVSPGATVTWTWDSGAGTHNVTFANASIADSGDITNGVYATVMPNTLGMYTYQCTLHSGMTGSVTVE